MPADPRLPPSLAAELAALRRDIDALKRRNPLDHTASVNGTLTVGGEIVLRDNGIIRAQAPNGRDAAVLAPDAAGNYALTIYDPSAAVGQAEERIRIGRLPGESYGLSQTEPITGTTIPLLALTSGPDGRDNTVQRDLVPNAAWVSTGPDIQVHIRTGRLIVFATADLTATGRSTTTYYSWELAGPDLIAPAENRAFAVSSTAGTVRMQGTFAYIHRGITPGYYQIRSRTRCVAAPNDGAAAGRLNTPSLLALPY
ncbi:hypothetical protein [Crossiella sp. CA198]|uniref:hypothetical protein n=1 Tax=Crossiella sp. CA198 TaxID=3455607 RepID=UPI003F8D5F49